MSLGFANLDLDGDARNVDLEAFIGGMREHFTEIEARELFELLDTDGDGRLSAAEFARLASLGGVVAHIGELQTTAAVDAAAEVEDSEEAAAATPLRPRAGAGAGTGAGADTGFSADTDAGDVENLLAAVQSLLAGRKMTGSGSMANVKYGGKWQRMSALPPAALRPNLLLWRLPKTKGDAELLRSLGVTHVLNCAAEHCDPSPLLPWCTVHGLHAQDMPGYDMLGLHFADACDFLHRALAAPDCKVLIHCQQGQNRSGLTALAYMSLTEPLLPALARTLALRPVILTNRSFVRDLAEFVAGPSQ